MPRASKTFSAATLREIARQKTDAPNLPKDWGEVKGGAIPNTYDREKDLVAAIMGELDRRGIFHWRNNTGALPDKTGRPVHFGLVGSSDILALLPGKFLAIEAKSAKGKPTPAQLEFLANVNATGHVGILAYNVETVIRAIDAALLEEGKP